MSHHQQQPYYPPQGQGQQWHQQPQYGQQPPPQQYGGGYYPPQGGPPQHSGYGGGYPPQGPPPPGQYQQSYQQPPPPGYASGPPQQQLRPSAAPVPSGKPTSSLSNGAQAPSGRVIDEKDEKSGGWLAKLKPRDPLDPPPPSWARQPDLGQRYIPFPTVTFKSKGHWLEDSFPLVYPAEEMLTHDVSTDDWKRFIEDIGLTGRISGGQKLVAGVLPATAHLGASGFFISKAIEKNMKKKKIPMVHDLIDKWNYEFFGPRRLKISMVAEWDESQESSSSDDSDSEDEGAHPPAAAAASAASTEGLTAKQLRRAEKRERKSKRREEKKERKQERREHKKERKDHRRLEKKGKYNMYVQCV